MQKVAPVTDSINQRILLSHAQIEDENCVHETHIVSLEGKDPTHPHNWSKWSKGYNVFATFILSISSAFGTGITANLMPLIASEFHVVDRLQYVLPSFAYLIGFIFGPLAFAPLSETYGRKPVLLVGSIGLAVWNLGSALSPNWASLLIFRYLAGTFGAPPINVMGGIVADIFDDSLTRGRLIALWQSTTLFGPLCAPAVAGAVGPYGWRWAFWSVPTSISYRIEFIFSAICLIFTMLMSETLPSQILKVKASRLSSVNSPCKYIYKEETHTLSLRERLTIILPRPFVFLFTEPLIIFSCLYMAFVYAVFYMMLQILPSIFPDVYHMSLSAIGSSFLISPLYTNINFISRAAIFNQVNASLKSLGTEYIDLLQIHHFDYDTPLEETMKALHDLVESGKVRYIGASSMWALNFARLQFTAEKNGWTKFISMQNHYNFLDREEEREMIRFYNDTGVGLTPWAPLCRGHLARPPSDFGNTDRSKLEKEYAPGSDGAVEPDLTIVKRVQEIAVKREWKMSHAALAWINKRVSSPIIGFSSIARIEEAIDSRGKTPTDEEEKYLEELYKPKAVSGHI